MTVIILLLCRGVFWDAIHAQAPPGTKYNKYNVIKYFVKINCNVVITMVKKIQKQDFDPKYTPTRNLKRILKEIYQM